MADVIQLQQLLVNLSVNEGRAPVGLAAVHGIVRQLGGYVEVQSEPARGSTFTIYLPKTDQVAPGPDRARPGDVSSRN
jgi:sensor histidine kinase regulating citrate/malate metabolism